MYEPVSTSHHCSDMLARHESKVRRYYHDFPTVFTRARGHELFDVEGQRYLDFFCGAGAVNFGHNPPRIREAVASYWADDGIVHSLDMATRVKAEFVQSFTEHICLPRGLEYRLQFTGPTGTNAVEAAIKLARKVTGRATVAHFTRGFHGMTQGALSVSGSRSLRASLGTPIHNSLVLPFEGFSAQVDGLDLLEALLDDPSSGCEKPAAIIFETIQAEGGIRVASDAWLQRMASIAKRHDILTIADDIQVGCGRAGAFFSFEPAGLRPDIVCLSKSLSGIGLPMSLVLIHPDCDRWAAGEHSGTFRGNNLAFVSARACIEHYWRDDMFHTQVRENSDCLARELHALVERFSRRVPGLALRGRGMIWGLDVASALLAKAVCRAAFRRHLLIESCGERDQVIKIMPPLVIPRDALMAGIDLIGTVLAEVASSVDTKEMDHVG